MPFERRRKPSIARMAERGFLRESGGQDARSERPARWHGQARPLRRDPRKTRMDQKTETGANSPSPAATGNPLPSPIFAATGYADRRLDDRRRRTAAAAAAAPATASATVPGSGTAAIVSEPPRPEMLGRLDSGPKP